ncbi:MAG: hypothetical protein DPW22_05355 [Alphaproteobacteria bacterium]|nr:hypothetical protein [Pseudorhodoplanes sp.]MCQ3942626.1 hypothetical protein [Alphaproteobacteria bacterium]GIK82326.1 MAG: hypothetical protein BroJett024_34310 [Alphaproteobacteria bacterium]
MFIRTARAIRLSLLIGLAFLGAQPASADEPIYGRWAIDPLGCRVDGDTAETAPLIVAQKTLKWFVASCLVGKSYKIGKALHLQLRCTNEGAYRSLPVRLDLVAADRLAVTWDGQRVKDMRRCR